MRTRPTRKDRTPPRRQRGFYMLEVLVAVLILAVGLLGLAALQSRALRYNHDAYVRSQAAMLANEIIEIMRSVHSSTDTANQAITEFRTATLPAGTSYDDTKVSGEDEVKRWLAKLGQRLPGGTGEIKVNTSDSELYDVIVRWTDRETNGVQSVTWTVRP